MIKFFRKIRQKLLSENKFSKYLIYAIGEIVLVVIGILIALSINNWNENRKTQNMQESLLINFNENLTADSIILQNNKQVLLKIIETHKQLHAFRKNLLEPDEIDNPQSIRGSFRNYSITKSNHPDIATKILNEELKEKIREYYRLLAFLENAYSQYDNVVKETVRPYLANNLALNPDFLFDNQSQSDKPEKLNLEQFYLIVKREDFGQILFESNLKATETVSILNEILDMSSALRLSIENELNVRNK
jgi:type II secretory pathway pseudopilin PulG